jgi:hypothetical protein
MVYVDGMRARYRGMIMCHMLADSIDELHAMADNLNLSRKHFQPKSTPHYDICQANRLKAIKLGAIEVNRSKVVELIHKYRAEQSREFA